MRLFCSIFLALQSLLHAEPLVLSFERFHAAKPDAVGGRLLYNELGCANCHGGDTGLPARKGPILPGITARQQAEWIRAFLSHPNAKKSGANMPSVIEAKDADAVLHYLAALKVKSSKPKVPKYMNAERGSDVFHTAGCVACHQPGADYQPPTGVPPTSAYTHASVSFPDLKAKYTLGTLTDFLSDPSKVRTDGRMPHIKLEASDVTDLAAHLLDMQQSDGSNLPSLKAFKPDAKLAARGAEVVKQARCASCHDLPKEAQVPNLPLKTTSGGCLADAPVAPAARYELSSAQKQSLKSYLEEREASLTAKQQADLTLEAMNCLQCHSRNEIGGPDAARKMYFTGDHNLGDTGMLPPPLKDAGRKMQTKWMTDVLAGNKRVRPYLNAQMPVYAELAKTLPALLEKADAVSEKPLPEGQPEHGQKLLGVMGGLGCITCHRWGQRPSLGIQALDISTLAARVRGPWLREYLIHPAAHRPGTLMPSFWPEGKAANQAILGGDTDAQIAAILAFSAAGKGLPEGYPSYQAGEFELQPKERPILQRTFMEDVGAQAIVVGFPAGMHFAYDAASARPALIWKGRFFDAYNTWFTRAAPFEKPLGDVIARWPTASSGEAQKRKFAGYKLDAAGVPTFLYEVNGTRVEEKLEPMKEKLHRWLKWDASGSLKTLEITHPPEATVEEAADSKPGQLHYLYSWK
jgi:cytochrome c2